MKPYIYDPYDELRALNDCALYGHKEILGEGVCCCGQVTHRPLSIVRFERRTGIPNMLDRPAWVLWAFDDKPMPSDDAPQRAEPTEPEAESVTWHRELGVWWAGVPRRQRRNRTKPERPKLAPPRVQRIAYP